MQNLLDDIYSETGCMYLSDLHHPQILPVIGNIVQHLDVEFYSLREWNDAVSYITGKNVSFETKKQAVDFLKAMAEGKRN